MNDADPDGHQISIPSGETLETVRICIAHLYESYLSEYFKNKTKQIEADSEEICV